MSMRVTVERNDPLKHIAGLIGKLSYRDMHRLAEVLSKHIQGDTGGTEAVAKGLLELSDEILDGESPDNGNWTEPKPKAAYR